MGPTQSRLNEPGGSPQEASMESHENAKVNSSMAGLWSETNLHVSSYPATYQLYMN